MSRFVVVVFPDEEQAGEGMQLLEKLNERGSISLYATALVGKDAEGRISQKEVEGRGPRGLVLGALVGGLAGLIGGPAIAAVGAAGGAIMGGWRDVVDIGVGSAFLDEVSHALKPGHWALVASLDEDWVTPLDAAMETVGGTVIRGRRVDVEDYLLRKEIEVARSEVADYEAELLEAPEEAKDRLNDRRRQAEDRIRRTTERVEARIERLQEEADAKVDALEEIARDAPADARKKIDARIRAVRHDYELRSRKLKDALKSAPPTGDA